MKLEPRGVRNKNPGNIRRSTDNWRGLAEDQTDPDFFVFESSLWGIRCIARILLNYQRKRHLSTIRQIIGRWAPPTENDTGAYVNAVAAHVHVMADAPLNIEDRVTMFLLVEAIIRHEQGIQPYGGDIIHAALTAAGINKGV